MKFEKTLNFRIFITLSAFSLACAAEPEGAPRIAGGAEPAPAVRGPERLPLDPTRSSLAFVGRTPLRAQRGHFATLSGQAELRPGGLERARLVVEAEVGSVQTLYPLLTRHLLSPDFFDAERHPRARFESRAIRALAGDGEAALGGMTHRIRGTLSLRGMRREIAFEARLRLTAESFEGSARPRLDRQRFGVRHPGLPGEALIEDEVELEVELYASRGAPLNAPLSSPREDPSAPPP